MNGRAFLDASFWIVYRDEKDGNHLVARRAMSELFRQRTHFVTTLPVACEIHAFFAREQHTRELVLKDLLTTRFSRLKTFRIKTKRPPLKFCGNIATKLIRYATRFHLSSCVA